MIVEINVYNAPMYRSFSSNSDNSLSYRFLYRCILIKRRFDAGNDSIHLVVTKLQAKAVYLIVQSIRTTVKNAI